MKNTKASVSNRGAIIEHIMRITSVTGGAGTAQTVDNLGGIDWTCRSLGSGVYALKAPIKHEHRPPRLLEAAFGGVTDGTVGSQSVYNIQLVKVNGSYWNRDTGEIRFKVLDAGAPVVLGSGWEYSVRLTFAMLKTYVSN